MTQIWRRCLLWSALAVLAMSLAAILSTAPARAGEGKIDPRLTQDMAAGQQLEFLVAMADQAQLEAAALPDGKAARIAAVATTLQNVARSSQGPVIAILEADGVPYRSYWIANFLWVRGDRALVERLAQRPDVAAVHANPWINGALPAPARAPAAGTAIEWGVVKINAPAAWSEGYVGTGIVVGGADTGYQWDHPALINQYAGWNGAAADHNYAWHDAIHGNNPNTPPGNPCGFDSPAPCDDHGHGTHTMGTMVGNDLDAGDPAWPAGATNAVGVAPGATWIACRNMEEGWGTPTTYIECYQWFMAPTDLNGANPDPARAPDAINNSWGCPPSEGCDTTAIQLMETTVQNVRAAGIVNVVSAGNSGSACNTVQAPPAFFAESFSIGATNGSDTIASFSSRGLSTWNGMLKPDVSAPGVSVRSSTPGGNYGFSSGTSMAAPHVAGLMALLLQARPSLAGDVDALEETVRVTAFGRTATQTCGGVPGGEVPNAVYGHGRVDAWAAIQYDPGTQYLPIIPAD